MNHYSKNFSKFAKNQKRSLVLFAVLFFFIAAITFLGNGNHARQQEKQSVEISFVEKSPKGDAGGVIIPASCGVCTVIDIGGSNVTVCSDYEHTAGECAPPPSPPPPSPPPPSPPPPSPPPPPQLSASCSPSVTSALIGQTVTWNSSPSGGTGSYSYSWSGTDGLSGSSQSIEKSYSSAGNKTGSVNVTSGSQNISQSCGNSVNISQPPPEIPGGSGNGGGGDGACSGFCATPSIIVLGGSSILSWSSINATSCSIDNGVGSVSTTGTKTISPLTTTTFTLTCSGPGGTATAKITVTVLPIPRFREIPPS